MKDVIPVFVLFSAPQTTEIYGFLVHRGWENRCMHELNNLNKSICFFQLKTWSAPELQESKLNHERDLIVVGPVSPKTAPSELWLILSLPGIHCIVLNFFNDYWFGTAHSRYYSLLMDFITISVPNRGIPFCMNQYGWKRLFCEIFTTREYLPGSEYRFFSWSEELLHSVRNSGQFMVSWKISPQNVDDYRVLLPGQVEMFDNKGNCEIVGYRICSDGRSESVIPIIWAYFVKISRFFDVGSWCWDFALNWGCF